MVYFASYLAQLAHSANTRESGARDGPEERGARGARSVCEERGTCGMTRPLPPSPSCPRRADANTMRTRGKLGRSLPRAPSGDCSTWNKGVPGGPSRAGAGGETCHSPNFAPPSAG